MHSTDTSKSTKDEVKRKYGRYAGLNNNRVRVRVTRNGKTYSHYVDDRVTFRGSYQKVKDPETGHYTFEWQDGSKNNKPRTIPLTSACQQLLLSIKPENPSDDTLVFPSPRNGGIMNYQNANRADGWWRKVVDPIKEGTTPYNCRDTFITEQIMKGDLDTIIGRYSDTSPRVIYQFDQ